VKFRYKGHTGIQNIFGIITRPHCSQSCLSFWSYNSEKAPLMHPSPAAEHAWLLNGKGNAVPDHTVIDVRNYAVCLNAGLPFLASQLSLSYIETQPRSKIQYNGSRIWRCSSYPERKECWWLGYSIVLLRPRSNQVDRCASIQTSRAQEVSCLDYRGRCQEQQSPSLMNSKLLQGEVV